MVRLGDLAVERQEYPVPLLSTASGLAPRRGIRGAHIQWGVAP